MINLTEDSRRQLVSRSRSAEREKGDGKTRYEKRLKSRFANNVRNYNKIDMNSLFRTNILTVNIEVKGETDDYIVTISFGGFLDILHEYLERDKGEINLRTIVRALVDAFNRDNVFIHCSCPDWKYRFAYWATKDQIIAKDPENRPSDITNPTNKLGAGCKHVMLVLANVGWLIKVASVINNYIKYMEKHREQQYAKFIYPAIYGKKYEKPVQTNIFGDDEIETDSDIIDRSNEEGRVRGRFSSENQPIRNPSIRKLRHLDDEVDDEVDING